MARRITAGIAGAPTVGALQVTPTAVLTSGNGVDITMRPEGTGNFIVDTNTQINSTFDLRFADADSSNWVAFDAPSDISENVTWTLPDADGTDAQVLTTDGAGGLSWTDKGVEVATSTSSLTHYIPSTVSSNDEVATFDIVTSLSIQPSTGIVSLNRGNIANSLGVGTASSGTEGEIRATNDVTAFFSSDESLKENVVTITDAINKVKQMRGVEFDWTDDYIESKGGEDNYFVRKHDVGVIAQEVEQVLPEVVAERDNGIKAVKYDRLVSVLIEAIKELSAEIDELKQR